MRSKLIIMLAALVALSLGLPLRAYAGTSGQADVTVTIGPVFYCEVHPAWAMAWSGITEADYNEGTEVASHPVGWTKQGIGRTVRIWTNSNWQLTMQGTGGPYFAVDPVLYPKAWKFKPVGDIVWVDGPGGGWKRLKESPTQVKTGTPGTFDQDPDKYSVPFTFRILLSWANDSPGVYEYKSVLFVLCAP